MKKISALLALGVLAASAANAAGTYTLSSVVWDFGIIAGTDFPVNAGLTPPPGYTNQLIGSCDGCGIATAVVDGLGNVTLSNGSKPIYGDAGGNGLFSVCNDSTVGVCPLTSGGGSNTIMSFGGNGTTTVTGTWTAAGVQSLVWSQAYCIDTVGTQCTGSTPATFHYKDGFGGPSAPGGTVNWSNKTTGDGTTQAVVTKAGGTGTQPWQQGNTIRGAVMCCALIVTEDANGLHITRQVELLASAFPQDFQAYTLNYTVPVPGAVWLFGSALGLLGLRRKS